MANSRKFLQPINLLNSATDPTSASQGDVYYNSTSDRIRFYDGTQWNDIGSGAGGGTTIFVSETTPIASSIGDAWFKSSTSELFIWDGTYWVEATSTVGTDLVNDLTPQLGGDLDANGFGIDNVDHIDFDTTTTTAATEGMLVWNSGEGTLDLGLKGGNVTLNLGQEEVALCYNGTGATLTEGTVVYVVGAQGQRPRIAKASASSESSSSKTFGVVTENIANGAEGFVTTFGIVRGLNTSAYAEGTALWLSTTAGEFTTTMPTQPNHGVFIGYCIRQHATSGQIFVNIQNGYEIQELHNVLITNVQDEDILAYDSTTGLWKNVPVPVSLPDQTGHSGEYLTTDGTNASWSPVAGGLVESGSSYPLSGVSNGKLFYNTENGRTAIYFDSIWKEFSYITDFGLDGGLYSTTVFDNSIDGGTPTTTVFVGAYDGGSY